MTPKGIQDKNIIINDGKITKITNEEMSCDTKIRADNLVVLPGLIDTHVHYGVYTPINEAAITESHAAAIGGITTMMRMLRLGTSYKKSLPLQINASKNTHYINYAIHASIFNDSQINEMEYCANTGVSSFKIYMNLGGNLSHVYMDTEPGATKLEDGKVEMNPQIIEEIIKTAAKLGLPVSVHAEDYESCACAMHESQKKGKDGLGMWSESRSPQYEAKAIKIVCNLARRYKTVLNIVHIGSRLALEQIKQERLLGTRIYTETCPHYLTITHENRKDYLAKVMPPIRTSQDVEAVWQSLIAGNINTIGTDHVANTRSVKIKDNVWDSLAGFPSIGALLPILLSEGFNRNRLSLEKLAALTSTNAAEIFSFPHKGTITVGADADITIVDTKLEKTLDHEMFGGHSDYSVYDGMTLKGWPIKTLIGGELVTDDFTVIGKAGLGNLVSPKQHHSDHQD